VPNLVDVVRVLIMTLTDEEKLDGTSAK